MFSHVLRCSRTFSDALNMFSERCSQDVLRMFSRCSQHVLEMFSLFHTAIPDGRTRSKFGDHGKHGEHGEHRNTENINQMT